MKFILRIPYLRIWAKAFDFKGKTNRKDFFIDTTISIVVLILLLYLNSKVSAWFLLPFFLHLFFPLLSLLVRRIRDTGNTPLLCLVMFIFPVGFVPIIIMTFLKSDENYTNGGTNKKGIISLTIGLLSSFGIIPIISLISLLIGFVFSENYTDEYNQKFKPLENRESILLVSGSIVYYEDIIFNINDFEIEGIYKSGYHVYNNNFYFLSEATLEDDTIDIYIYKTDLNGENIKLVFTKNINSNRFYRYTNESNFYFSYDTDTCDDVLDVYNLNTGLYSNVGENINAADYVNYLKEKEKYSVYYDIDYNFLITDLSTATTKIVDENLLMTYEAGRYLVEYDYRCYNSSIIDNRIYLTYALDDSSYMSSNYYLLFEYDFDNNFLTFIISDVYINNIFKII